VQTTVKIEIKVSTPPPAIAAGGIIPTGNVKQEPKVNFANAVHRQRDPKEKTMEMSGSGRT
jgi:hypothetical protein